MHDSGTEELVNNLAHNLVEIRQKRHFTQEALAKLVGVPRSTIANLESGEGNPSLGSIAKIAAALQIPIEQLLVPKRAKCTLFHADELIMQERAQGAVKIFKLLVDPIPNMEIERLELMGGAIMKGLPHPAGTKEYLHCIQGEITVKVLGHIYLIKKGSVLAFPGEVNHTYTNTGKNLAIGVSVVVIAPIGT